MTPRILVLVAATLAACRSGATAVPEARADESRSDAGRGVAVVELFTSEGCSSCPPADRVLAELAQQGDRPVLALAFHVDYWDELGWMDRFASHDGTARQRAYARAFGTSNIYTPQMIVGGTEQFTGSDRAHADAAIARALARPAPVQLAIRVRRTAPGTATIDYDAPGAPQGALLTVALVQRAATSVVGAGENAGKTLHHVDVVRAFESAPASRQGLSSLPVPNASSGEEMDVVAFVQRAAADDGAGMPVLGATRAPLPPGEKE